jgi:hypothetical protein
MATKRVQICQSAEVTIPPRIQGTLHLKIGAHLEIESTPVGVVLSPTTLRGGVRTEGLHGPLKTDVPIAPLGDLCEPVDHSAPSKQFRAPRPSGAKGTEMMPIC